MCTPTNNWQLIYTVTFSLTSNPTTSIILCMDTLQSPYQLHDKLHFWFVSHWILNFQKVGAIQLCSKISFESNDPYIKSSGITSTQSMQQYNGIQITYRDNLFSSFNMWFAQKTPYFLTLMAKMSLRHILNNFFDFFNKIFKSDQNWLNHTIFYKWEKFDLIWLLNENFMSTFVIFSTSLYVLLCHKYTLISHNINWKDYFFPLYSSCFCLPNYVKNLWK
jgi:hypothetical protein